ncbi:hypothetical protein [Parafrankia sp. EUN1f]|uniref:hypothetical protein n=1 Tax=Parafrankia sp. EUN1f TaxID=102897 RepID=UPI0001C4718F|nr:hypothetical protein [Parafrankia sp. EUN1f]EFC79584.1 hypothetical protein FrEUN1fDRAFT_7307 [Parafrankia sp. EUN1f]
MGSGSWSTNVYEAAAGYRARSGASAFQYSDSLRANRPRQSWKAHPDLDPWRVGLRESRDNDEHPESLAISVLFDVTGSMGQVPRTLQTRLPELFGLLLRKGYVQHPQILFGGIGDASCDRVPLQIGQFESDNRMDDQLGAMLLEGGGGGQMHESYELALYFMARHTATDCFDRRGRRGYLFIVGDELPYGRVSPSQVAKVIGDQLTERLSVERILAEVERRYHVYFIIPAGTSHAGDSEVLGTWRALLGERVLELDDLDAVCETIAVTIGLGEAAIDLDEGLDDLRDVGSAAAVPSVGRALERYSREVAVRGSRSVVVRGSGALDRRIAGAGSRGIARL